MMTCALMPVSAYQGPVPGSDPFGQAFPTIGHGSDAAQFCVKEQQAMQDNQSIYPVGPVYQWLQPFTCTTDQHSATDNQAGPVGRSVQAAQYLPRA
jgi:hypothetical protein